MLLFFDLTWRELGQSYRNILVRLVVQIKTLKFASAINWPFNWKLPQWFFFNLHLFILTYFQVYRRCAKPKSGCSSNAVQTRATFICKNIIHTGCYKSHDLFYFDQKWSYSSNKIRKTPNKHLNIVCQNLNCL